jgi:hypothetical protein
MVVSLTDYEDTIETAKLFNIPVIHWSRSNIRQEIWGFYFEIENDRSNE